LAVFTPQISTFPCMASIPPAVFGFRPEQYFPAGGIHTMADFVWFSQKIFPVPHTGPFFTPLFTKEPNFSAKLFPTGSSFRRRHNAPAARTGAELCTGICMVLHRSKPPGYLLKTATFPHCPQTFPQGFSTGRFGCGYAF